jgi:hypothetical protein
MLRFQKADLNYIRRPKQALPANPDIKHRDAKNAKATGQASSACPEE